MWLKKVPITTVEKNQAFVYAPPTYQIRLRKSNGAKNAP